MEKENNYIEQAQLPDESMKVSEPVMVTHTTQRIVHIPVDAHGQDINWSALQTWLAMQAQTYVEQAHRPTEDDAIWLDNICGGWQDDPRTTEEIKKDIRSSRQSGVTRKIKALTHAE